MQTWLDAPGKGMVEGPAELLTTSCCVATGVLGNIVMLPWGAVSASMPITKSGLGDLCLSVDNLW